jgi:glucose-6-phosphate 1-dehydrogenase
VWNRRYIDHVQISVAETVGVEGRGSYFDQAGSLRDMVPNHIMQLISLTAMEPPISFDANAVRDEQAKILHAIQPMSDEEVLSRSVRGQYGDGTEDGKRVPAYRAEPDVPPESRTETFVALKTYLDNWRWSGVPFFIRTGKRMKARASSIYVQFKDVPQILFNRDSKVPPNALIIRIQPDEGFSFDVMTKRPGLDLVLQPVRMNLSYNAAFGDASSPEGYERLLLDVMDGDHTLFISAQFVEKSWEFVQGVLDAWSDPVRVPIVEYPAGSWGPKEADQLIRFAGRQWHEP